MSALTHPTSDQTPSRGAMLRIPSRAHRLTDFRQWALSDDVPEKLPLTFVAGEVFVDMSKEEIRSHALVKTALGGDLNHLNREIDFGHLFINRVLVTNPRADVSNNPDLVLVSYRSLKSGRVRYIERDGRLLEIEGSPDILIEIVSDSSVVKDAEVLRKAYHRARVPEYWLIDARGDEIVFEILHRRRLVYKVSATGDWQESRVLHRLFRLTRALDQAGSWKYDLQVRQLVG